MIKLFKNLLISVAIMTISTAGFAGVVVPKPAAPGIAAESYILMDHDSGEVLAENAADERLPPASITKLMTSYVVSHELEAGNIKLFGRTADPDFIRAA